LRLLIDTHYVIWLTTDHSRITALEWDALNNPEHELMASTISIWEMRLKWNSLHVSGDRKGWIDPIAAMHYLDSIQMKILVLSPETAATPLATPIGHRDPFDELLLVQAQQTGARLFTRDRVLQAHPLVYQSS